jgi:tRNA-intron endonuclease
MQNTAGTLDGKHIFINDPQESSQIYNKGYFGTTQSGGGLKLDMIEAIYLAEVGKLTVRKNNRKVSMEKLYRFGNELLEGFEIKYIVYRDLRQRGYVVKPGSKPLDFRVLPRGGIPGKNPSKFWVVAISERGSFDVEEVVNVIKRVRKVKKILLLAVVDEESDLTYYKAKVVKPRGRVKSEADFHIANALFLMDRVLVLEPSEATMLHSIEFFGKPIGNYLQLSLLETAYLMERGLIKVTNATTGRKMQLKRFKEEAIRVQGDFNLRFEIYKDLKQRGILVKTGFKYGSHFRAYEGDPDDHHARYLVHAIPENFIGMWAEVSRAVRLAHGVKKDILLARKKTEKKAEYLRLRRVRP